VSLVYDLAAIPLLRVADGTVSLLISFMESLVAWGTGAVELKVAHPNSWNVLALFFGMLLLLSKAVCRRGRVIPLMFCVLPIPERFLSIAGKNNILILHVVDVGQGIAVIVQIRHQLFLMIRVRISVPISIPISISVP